jgi:hypothetical protein
MTRNAPPRRGSTLVEVIASAALSTVLIYVVAMSWAAFDRASIQVVTRCEAVREADLALSRLADDLRGWSSARPDGRSVLADGGQLQLIFSDRTIVYSTRGGRLLREDTATGAGPEPVAWSVESLAVRRPVADEPLYEFALTIAPRPIGGGSPSLRRTFLLVANLP